MTDNDAIVTQVRGFLDEYAHKEVERFFEVYLNLLHTILGVPKQSAVDLLSRMPKDSRRIATTCMGVNKNGKSCTKRTNDGTGYCQRHLCQHPQFSVLQGNAEAATTSTPPLVISVPDIEDEEDDLREFDAFRHRR